MNLKTPLVALFVLVATTLLFCVACDSAGELSQNLVGEWERVQDLGADEERSEDNRGTREFTGSEWVLNSNPEATPMEGTYKTVSEDDNVLVISTVVVLDEDMTFAGDDQEITFIDDDTIEVRNVETDSGGSYKRIN